MPRKLVASLALVFVSVFLAIVFPKSISAQDLCEGYRNPDPSCVVCARGSNTNGTFSCERWASQDTQANVVNCNTPGQGTCNICLGVNASGTCTRWGESGTESGGAPVIDSVNFNNPDLNTYVKGQETTKPNNQQLVKSTMSGVASWVVCGLTSPTTRCVDEGGENASLQSTLASLIGGMYKTPPADTQAYIADVLHHANIATPAYAQGLGFSSLTPILGAWKIFRNIAYLFFIVIILVIGFMIMFRQKLSGQTVVTAQQALPNVIVSLIFVTFSYAIAGLLIDVMYLIMYFMLAVFGKVDNSARFITSDIFSLGATLINGTTIQSAGSAIDQVVSSVLSNTSVSAISAFAGIAAMVIFSISMIIGVFRLFFELLKTYVNILMSIVLSPILLMVGALPGKNVFKDWIQDLIGNLAAFPVVLLILIVYDQLTNGISAVYLSEASPSVYNQGGFMPPYLLGYGAGAAEGIFRFIIGLGILLTMTELVKQAKKMLGAKENFGWFASGLQDAIKRGWQGDQLVPGLGFTDLRKWPGGGVSGQNITRKLPELGVGLAGGLFGGARLATKAPSLRKAVDYGAAGFKRGFVNNEKRVAETLGDDKPIFSKAEKKK